MKRPNREDEVLRILTETSAKGDPRAQYNLGAIYATGEFGVVINRATAAKWYEKAAKQGHSEAKYNLGIMILRGEGRRANRRKGLAWIRNADKDNFSDAQELLGEIYEFGAFGLRRNYGNAIKWYR